jgi:hypothetical protein
MYRRLQARLLTGTALGLVIVALTPIASASSSPGATVPAWLARIQYPGTHPEASVVIPRVQAPPPATPVIAPARSFDWGAFGIGVAAATGIALTAACSLLAMRRRRAPAHA